MDLVPETLTRGTLLLLSTLHPPCLVGRDAHADRRQIIHAHALERLSHQCPRCLCLGNIYPCRDDTLRCREGVEQLVVAFLLARTVRSGGERSGLGIAGTIFPFLANFDIMSMEMVNLCGIMVLVASREIIISDA